ncbi:imidazole glycerol phosphate synthase subunit HisH [Haloplasma contractile]|uniref:Imidazole glycerol phosphate synthase subunit HisH n=1 Tax=Haloplasma contractile SSD-17B TaxID=1033810 RepID=U2DU12_9MOLU|nr:imidazole glycerol phosphate synthase subunit HisH [Haloplasma contractile]ERJ11937.1 Imidazole glycerol phosphate synthase subunit HisH protein [Haloplasma contractile SSD-17B]
MVTIIDYGVGNLDSIERGFERVGIKTVISSDHDVIKNASSLVLPGVGAFSDAIAALESTGLIPLIKEHVRQKKYILGICLGMQLLYETSHEYGKHKGLGFIKGSVDQLTSNLKVPHMGWNCLEITAKGKGDPFLKYIETGDYVYYVHSYYVNSTNEELLASTKYGVNVPGIVRSGTVYGTQFHPEKSGEVGLKLLKAYGELIK